MDRLFLDANILFSAEYRANAGLQKFWKLRDAELCSSHYALEEARINLSDEEQRDRLIELAKSIKLFDPVARALPGGITLAEKRHSHFAGGDCRTGDSPDHWGPSRLRSSVWKTSARYPDTDSRELFEEPYW